MGAGWQRRGAGSRASVGRRIWGLGGRGCWAGQAWFRRHPIRRKGLSIREPVFVIGHGVGVQAGLVGVGTAHALWRRSGRRVVPGTEVAKDLLGHALFVQVSVLTIVTRARPPELASAFGEVRSGPRGA